ncbi:MAG TPA: response regulator [Nitrosopumilaceae archaeon]|nr:response regulator [Nitrosopumilaceae archaeon]
MAKILVVDDEPDIALSLKNGLTNNGFEVDAYTEPLKALDDFKPNVYDLSLFDIRMPKMNGFELCREIKKKETNAKICLMTAFEIYHDEFRRIFPTLNVQCFIRKPIGIKDLISHIKLELNIS